MITWIKRLAGKDIFVLAVLMAILFALYWPVLDKYLASDDFHVMRRVGLEKQIFIRNFFRPLSDITLYFCYMLGGFNATYYNVVSMIIHGFTAFFIFLFCSRSQLVSPDRGRAFGWVAALLFATYPFHNESIIWGVGKASLVAAFFGVAALLTAASNRRQGWKYFWACLFYFVGLAAYESIFFIPLIVFVMLLWKNGKSFKEQRNWVIFFAATMALHLIVRVSVSKSVVGEYGGGIFSLSPLQYASHFFKMMGRLFLPPMESSRLLMVGFACGILIIIICSVLLLKNKERSRGDIPYIRVLACLLASVLVPLTFPVSTKTSESDRLLYFPSVFFCMMLAFFVVRLATRSAYLYMVTAALLAYNIFFLEKNNTNWRKASDITVAMLKEIQERSQNGKHLWVVNVPEEMNGAYIFRNGFNDALVIHQIDTGKVTLVNHLHREEYNALPALITPVNRNDTIFIPPAVYVVPSAGGEKEIRLKDSLQFSLNPAESELLFWNKSRLVKINMPAREAGNK